MILLFACGGDNSSETRLVNCRNNKPANSSWSSENISGLLMQSYDGVVYQPSADECSWTCDQGFNQQEDQCQPDGGSAENDDDNDGVGDKLDNCPFVANPEQVDTDQDGQGDACEVQDGSLSQPFIIAVEQTFTTIADTSNSLNSNFDSYPGWEHLDHSGPEDIYIFRVNQESTLRAAITSPEPAGVDIDLHLLSSLDPVQLIARDDSELNIVLGPGLYYLIMDSFGAGSPMVGPYNLTVRLSPLDWQQRELRGTWVSSVAHLDWPKAVHLNNPAEQKADLQRMFDLYQ